MVRFDQGKLGGNEKRVQRQQRSNNYDTCHLVLLPTLALPFLDASPHCIAGDRL
jgi:hypothetical protein